MDFTYKKYQELLISLKEKEYDFRTFESFCKGNNPNRFVMLRHDVDTRPLHSLQVAKIEYSLEIPASYYFRIVPKSNHPEIIKQIVALGHEIGYHYEDLTLAKGDSVLAIDLFKEHLEYFRQFYPVTTICMHGSPMSSYDNREIWDSYNYKEWNLIGEPYFDIDFQEIAYITDTGRKWNDLQSNRRDKVATSRHFQYRTTNDLIEALLKGYLPEKIMITTHPQRWTDNVIKWTQELVLQSIKNQIKKCMIR